MLRRLTLRKGVVTLQVMKMLEVASTLSYEPVNELRNFLLMMLMLSLDKNLAPAIANCISAELAGVPTLQAQN